MPEAAHQDQAGRVDQAMAFLQEAVYRSRAAQASSAGLPAPASAEGPGGQCGLGEKAAVVLDLSEHGRALFNQLWPTDLAPKQLEALRLTMATWIERQDALGRKRNHFMKAFRQTHGFDRTAYTEAQQAEWTQGLAAVNDDINARLRTEANALLAETD